MSGIFPCEGEDNTGWRFAIDESEFAIEETIRELRTRIVVEQRPVSHFELEH